MDDEEAFEGPDAYVDEYEEYDIDDQVAEDDHDEGEDGLDMQRRSIVDMLNSMPPFSFSKSDLIMYGFRCIRFGHTG